MYIWWPPLGPSKRSQARPQKSLAGKVLVSVMKALLDVLGATMCSECEPLWNWSVPTVAVNPLAEVFQALPTFPVSKSSQSWSDPQSDVPAPAVPAPPAPMPPVDVDPPFAPRPP